MVKQTVTIFLNNKKLCELKWDELPNVGMSFYHEKREYMILEIKDDGSKISVKDISNKKGSKK